VYGFWVLWDFGRVSEAHNTLDYFAEIFFSIILRKFHFK